MIYFRNGIIHNVNYVVKDMCLLSNINRFITEKENEGWSEKRLVRAKRRLAVFCADLSETDKFTEETLTNWDELLQERGLSERTRSEYLTLVRQFLEAEGYGHFVKKRGKPLQLAGKRFGELKVLEKCPEKRSKERSILWKCQCSCGKVLEIPANELTKGLHTSCGCKKAERLKEINQYVDGTSLKMIFSDTVRKDNSSGYKGVYWKEDRWAVRIQYKGKRYFLGAYDKLEDAIKARQCAEERIREEAKDEYYSV